MYCTVGGGGSVPWRMFSTVGAYIKMHVGAYLEYRGVVQYRGGYHDKCGGIMSTIFCYLSTSTVLNNTHGTLDISPHNDIPRGTQITKDDIPHGTEHTLFRGVIALWPSSLSGLCCSLGDKSSNIICIFWFVTTGKLL